MKIKSRTRKPKKPNSELFKDSYDEKSPITGEYSVLVEELTNPNNELDLYKICMQTGYHTYSKTWRTDNPTALAVIEKQMPSYIVDSKIKDNLGVVWYPMMSMSIYGLLHPIKVQNQLKWAVSSIEKIQNENELNSSGIIKLPIQTTEGVRIGLFKVNDTPMKTWEFNEFEHAFDYYQNLISENMNTNE